jgi:hypothetical protein
MSTTTKTARRFRTVAGVLAVTIACSTGAYAAGAVITSSNQIKSGVVNSGDLKNGTVKVKDLNQKTVAALEPAVEAWRNFGTPGNPSLQTFWGVHGDGYQAPGFRIDNDGVVHLRGAVSINANVASGSDITTLPVGYRPAACQVFDVATFDGSNGNQDPEGAVQICADGAVFMFKEGDDRLVDLSGVSFSAS